MTGSDVEIRPGMPFALKPNCALGKRVVNLAETVAVGEDEEEDHDLFTSMLEEV